MNKAFKICCVIPFMVIGCSGNSSSSVDHPDIFRDGVLTSPGAPPKEFSFTEYVDQHTATSNETLAGTWVGRWDTNVTRSDPSPGVSVASKADARSLIVMVIQVDSEDASQYKQADCQGRGFVSSKVVNNSLDGDGAPPYLIEDNKLLSWEDVSSYSVTLFPDRSYTETVAASARFVKVSDSTEPLGVMSLNWSDSVAQEKDVYCFSLSNRQGGYRDVYVGSDDSSRFKISTLIDPATYEALILDPAREGGIVNRYAGGSQRFSLSEEGSHQFTMSFMAEGSSGLSVSGTVSVTIPYQ
jgi:hypothetical protein